MKKSIKRKMQELLNSRNTCSSCKYYSNGYCRDRDVYMNPDDYCGDEYYYS